MPWHDPRIRRRIVMHRRNWAALPLLTLATLACLAGCSGSPEEEVAADGESALSGPFKLYRVTPDAGPGRPWNSLCYQLVNGSAPPRCEIVSFTKSWSDEERRTVMEAATDARLVVRARLTHIANSMIGTFDTWETEAAWVAPKLPAASAAPAKPVYEVHRSGQAITAKVAGKSNELAVSSLDLASAGTPAEVAQADEQLDGKDGVLVAGSLDPQSGALKAERLFLQVEHVLTMFETWNFEQGPGDVMNGATYRLPKTAKLEFTLDNYAANPPEPTKKDLDHVAGFTVSAGSPSLYVTDTSTELWNCPKDSDRNKPGCANGQYAQTMRWFSFQVPKGATTGQKWVIKSQPKAGSANQTAWDFSFTIEVGDGAQCRATYVGGAKANNTAACF